MAELIRRRTGEEGGGFSGLEVREWQNDRDVGNEIGPNRNSGYFKCNAKFRSRINYPIIRTNLHLHVYTAKIKVSRTLDKRALAANFRLCNFSLFFVNELVKKHKKKPFSTVLNV